MKLGNYSLKYLAIVLSLLGGSSLFAGNVSEHKQQATREASKAAYLDYLDSVQGRDAGSFVEIGIKLGVMEGVQAVIGQSVVGLTGPVVQDAAKPAAECIKYPFKLASKWFNLLVFGSHRLAWNDIAKLNNTVFDLIHPMTVQSLGDLTKERRAEIVGGQHDSNVVVDKAWIIKKRYILLELSQIISFAKHKAACYDTGSANFLRKLMGDLYGLFATEKRDEISRSVNNAIQYLTEIQDLLETFTSSKHVEQNRDLLKFLLARTMKSFKDITIIIDEDIASQPAGAHQPGYLKLNEMSAQGMGGLAGLDQLFADGNAGGSSN